MTKLYTIISNDKDFSEALKGIRHHGAKVDDAIQTAGVYALEQAVAGNMNQLNELTLAMPKGSRLAALGAWATAYGPVNLNDGKDKAERPFRYAKSKAETADIAAAKATPWFTCKPDSVNDGALDIDKAIAALLKKAAKAEEAGKLTGDLAKLTALRGMVAA